MQEALVQGIYHKIKIAEEFSFRPIFHMLVEEYKDFTARSFVGLVQDINRRDADSGVVIYSRHLKKVWCPCQTRITAENAFKGSVGAGYINLAISSATVIADTLNTYSGFLASKNPCPTFI